MKIKKLFKLMITNACILFITTNYTASNKSASNLEISENKSKEKNYNGNNKGLPGLQISENELKEIMQNAVEEYQRMPETEKELMCQQLQIKKEELDEIMKEASIFVEEMNLNNSQKNDTLNKTENIFIENKNEENNEIIKPKNQESKNITKERINTIEKAIRTLQVLNLKANDEFIRTKITEENDNILLLSEKLIYYFLLIKQFLLNNEVENKNLIQENDLNTIISIAHKINQLKENIEKLITLNEFEKTNIKNDLFEKYNVKNRSPKELQSLLEEKIKSLKKEIKNIESQETETEIQKKEKTKKIINIEYKIDIIETDLINFETNQLETKKNNTAFTEYQKLLSESLESIIRATKLIFENISEIEEIIKKSFPNDYKISKQKEDERKKQLAKERKIREQKGSTGETHTEKNIPFSNQNKQEKNINNEFKNDFQSSNSNDNYYDYENEERNNEKTFDFQKNEPTNQSEKNEPKKENKSVEKNLSDQNEKNEHDISSKKNIRLGKKTKDKKEKEQKEKEQDDLKKIINNINKIIDTIKDFIENNPEYLYSQSNTKELATILTNKTKDLEASLSNLSKETIKSIGKDNPLIKEKNNNDLKYIKEEIKKTELLKIEIEKNIKEPQIALYKLYELKELLEKSFNDLTRKKEFEIISNNIKKINEIIDAYKEKCKDLLKEEKQLPYWLRSIEDIEKETELNKKKEAENNKQ